VQLNAPNPWQSINWRSLFVEHYNTVAPRADDVLDTLVHLCSSRFAIDTRHKQYVVVGVDMADGGDDGRIAAANSPRKRTS
jgi:hypothetical protein